MLELITKSRKLNEITKSFLNLTVQTQDWLGDVEPVTTGADAAWEDETLSTAASSSTTAAPAATAPSTQNAKTETTEGGSTKFTNS